MALLKHPDDGVGDYSKPMLREQLIKWLQNEIDRVEKEIDDGGAFYTLESERDTYETVIDKIYEFD
jgi:hypothetical protein